VTNALAYCAEDLITAVKSFVVLAPRCFNRLSLDLHDEGKWRETGSGLDKKSNAQLTTTSGCTVKHFYTCNKLKASVFVM
jgi:hypothetical protein